MADSLRIKSNYIHLKEVECFLQNVLGGCQLSQKQFAYITLVVCESVNNAINHGNNFDENKYVTLFTEVGDEFIAFEVHDEGNGFDYSKVPDPTLEENIRSEGGRGLFIIRNLADELSFRDNGSVIHIKFKIDRAHTISS